MRAPLWNTINSRWPVSRLWIVLAVAVGVVAAGCGDDELSLTEYVDEVNELMVNANEDAAALLLRPEGPLIYGYGFDLDEYTPQQLQLALESVGEIEAEVSEAADAIEPPEVIADLHRTMFDSRFTIARSALARRAGEASSWEELSATPEMAAYRAAVAKDKEICIELQAELDATAERGAFADAPWVPAEMKEVVVAVLGCDAWPERPEDIFRPGASP
jgi:hypothetical protein